MNLIKAVSLAELNKSNNKISVVSSFNFQYYKYFLNAFFYKNKINLKIDRLFSENLELDLLKNLKSRTENIWFFVDWCDLLASSSLRTNFKNFNIFEKKNIKSIDNLIKIINRFSEINTKISIFSPHTKLLYDNIFLINYKNTLPSVDAWHYFKNKISYLKKKKIKFFN